MSGHEDLRSATAEFADDAQYAWWRDAHPHGYVLDVRARKPPLLHRPSCDRIDRDRHPGALRAAGSRQVCADTTTALRAWLARELPGASPVLARCPRCGP